MLVVAILVLLGTSPGPFEDTFNFAGPSSGVLVWSGALLWVYKNHYKTNGFEHIAFLEPSLDLHVAADVVQMCLNEHPSGPNDTQMGLNVFQVTPTCAQMTPKCPQMIPMGPKCIQLAPA